MKLLFGAVCALILSYSVHAETQFEGDIALATDSANWSGENVLLSFHYNNNGEFDGFKVSFEPVTTLFNNWKLVADDGTRHSFPFILEVTLVIDTKDQVTPLAVHVGDKAPGRFWGYGIYTDSACSEMNNTYFDSTLDDWMDDNDKFGIGIVNPYQLDQNSTYKFWMHMKPEGFNGNPNGITASLRFRLNVNVSKAKSLGFSYESLENLLGMGTGAKLGYNIAFSNSPDLQQIAEYFSFAIVAVKGTSETADAFVKIYGNCDMGSSGPCNL